MMKQIRQNKLCPAQEVFTKCIRSWLEYLETSILDMSSVHESRREFLEKAISDQERIRWHLAMRGYLSKYWSMAVAANHHLKEDNDKGRAWVRKTVLQLWEFSREMWEHRNDMLHNTQLESSRTMQNAEINDAITKVDTYAAEDR
jgi:hypothetical protein